MEKIVKGYILKVVPYKESNAIITLLTKEGLESFMARGVLKPTSKNASSCQLYSYGEYQLSYKTDNSNNILTSGTVINTLIKLYEDLRYSAILGLLSESIIKNDDFVDSYEIFDVVFKHLLNGRCNYSTIIAIILKYNAFYSGCDLEADSCVRCGITKSIVNVSFSEGGLICKRCASELHLGELSSLYIKNFRYIVKAEMEHIEKFELNPIIAKTLIIDFFDFLEKNAGIYFKSKVMILHLL